MNLVVIDQETQRELPTGYEIRLTGWTEERYWAKAPADRFCEFVDGEVIMPSPVDIGHQMLVGFLTFLLKGHCRRRTAGLVVNGPAAVRLRPRLVREPDIFVLSPEDGARVKGSKIEACPLLVVEVADKDSERRDLGAKAAEYAARGIPEYWVPLLTREQVVVHRLAVGRAHYEKQVVGEGRLDSTALGGFWVDVGWLWRPSQTDELRCLARILGVDALGHASRRRGGKR